MYGIFCTHIKPEARAYCRNLYWGRKLSSTILNPNSKINIPYKYKKFPRISTAWHHMVSSRKKNCKYVKSLLHTFGITKVLFLWTRCLEGHLSILADVLEHYQLCILLFFELFQEEICQKWWSSMISASHSNVGTSETVKNFYGECYSANTLVLISQKNLSQITLLRSRDGNRSIPIARPKSYFHYNSFYGYVSHFASSRDNVNFI